MFASRPIKDKRNLSDIQDYLRVKNPRDYIIFIIGLRTGYRTQDIVDLKIKDIKKALSDGRFVIKEKKKFRNYKTRKEKKTPGYTGEAKPRVVEFSKRDVFYKILSKFVEGKPNYDYAFKSQKGDHIKVDSFARNLKVAGEYFGIYNLGAHTPRKTYGYNLYINSGKDIVIVKKALGHSSIDITERYIGIEEEFIEKCSEVLENLICI
ncbi:tyrosine-type recombinase/integrase [Clostridium perfringens]|uniref:tyrosine-type recombinase/integrase n=1 Tax=Clostridium perfringens TaxID=1502 RepID=UPI0013E2E88C|nr:tyrosine-type recombinase/integrase [Clostridium perfringens]MCX0363221.1 tyrosine-type recombinase/integrase [Clostridium perfringens]NGT54744.1 tyrosine-type recombinase/integrase [Clostridium perfringens]NGT94712.1 tyrosine-type recombinase/integrase [Clostridium perfringens]